MIDHPDMHEPATAQEKLVLPAPPEQRPAPPVYSDPRLQVPDVYSDPRMQVPPEMLIRHNAPPLPRSPLAKLVYFWRKDPAYKVLMIAVAMVVIAGLLLTTFVTSTLLHGFSTADPVVQNPVATTQPVGTVDNRPTFPTPGGGDGSTVTSQPPMQSTPILQPTTPPIQPSPSPPASGTLSLQITNIPNHVRNNTGVDVGVNTNEANISVSLVILYSSFPYRGTAGPVTTDTNGSANIRWFVFINAFSNRAVTASVYAVARDQNGQIVRSQPATVQVSMQGGGGGM
jgi:hypothetical protein